MSYAERLLALSKRLHRRRQVLVVAIRYVSTKEYIEEVALANRFTKTPLSLQFKALVENWSRSRIVSEISIYL